MRSLLVLITCVVLLIIGAEVLVEPVAGMPSAAVAFAATAEPFGEPAEPFVIPGERQTEQVLKTLVIYLSFFAEMCGAIIIGVAIVREFLRYLPHILRTPKSHEDYQEDIRLRLGRSLALALEFELGADILRTAIAPTLEVLAIVGAVVVLRTVLNFFLERELRQVEERRKHNAAPPQQHPREQASG